MVNTARSVYFVISNIERQKNNWVNVDDSDEANRLRFVPYSQPGSKLYLKLHRTAYWSPITLRFLRGLITSSGRYIMFPPAPTL